MPVDSYDAPTGGGGNAIRNVSRLSSDIETGAGSSTFYIASNQSSGSDVPGVTVRPRAPQRKRRKPQQKQAKSTPARRDALRRGLQQANREGEAMLSAAESGEITRCSNMAFRLRDTLQTLWDLREEREEDWGDLLNTIQIAFGIDDYDVLTTIQCRAVRDVIADHLTQQSVDLSDIESSVRKLRQSGLDPFRSGTADASEGDDCTEEFAG